MSNFEIINNQTSGQSSIGGIPIDLNDLSGGPTGAFLYTKYVNNKYLWGKIE